MSENCCRGGLISAWAIDPLGSFSSFEMTVVSLDGNSTVYPPANLTLLAPDPGYNCGPVVETTPIVSSDLGGRRQVQVYRFLADEVALFWGLQAYSDELLQPDQRQLGSVLTGILFEKDSGIFILRNGWALPRRIYFIGEECAMPLPDTFPVLPNGSSCTKPPRYLFLLLLIYMDFKSQASWL
ncbi:hypothetical protein OIU84_014932 [Salix udensis]|uniref:COBRA C-terminal domain-containing protein n=1 Tax=Salix udensis TaxID=889485 RepID=A0AAD6JDK9_9ROSI|nr:hypothetical protein OIU84_014932 [Salix udensis]